MRLVRWVLLTGTLAGLGVDGFVHLRLAGTYDAVGATVSEGLLFRLEGALALLAGLLLALRPGRRTAAVAAVVAGGGLAVLLLYRYVDVGEIGPLPDLYEPFWFPDKTVTAMAQSVATVAAVGLVVLGWPASGRAS